MQAPIAVYRLRIALPHIAPPIWRELEISSAITFAQLHDAIQVAMGWEDCHLWTFYVGKTEVGPGDELMDSPFLDAPGGFAAEETTLEEMLEGRRIRFRYVYDMGDDWVHEIKVEKVFAPEPGVQYPRCTGGARTCPPEDCGGIPGYIDILEAISDPKHPEREEMLEWLGEDFDPDAFDIDAVNRRLQPARAKRTRPAAGKK